MNKSAYLIVGIRIKEDEFPGDRWEDEKWIPYSEGRTGLEIEFHTGEGDKHLYVGKVLEKLSVYSDAEYYEISLDLLVEEKTRVDLLLSALFDNAMSSHLMLVELWG